MVVAIGWRESLHRERRVRAAWRWWWSKRWRKWGTIAAISFVVMQAVTIEVTSQSWFCNSCHIMNPYYHSWQTGTHKDVECVSCHIPPGATNYLMAKLNGAGQVVDDLLERTSTKPSASVSDFSCTRSGCHDMEKVKGISRKEGKYFFNHSKHLNMEYLGIEMHCTTCHSHVQGSKHFEVNTNVCVTCHLITPGAAKSAVQFAMMNGAGERAATRPATVQAVVDWQPIATAEMGKTPPGQCKTCHEAPKKAIEYRGLKIVHDEYVSYGAACESCHRNVTARPERIDSSQCFSCHEFGMEKFTSVRDMHQKHAIGRHKVECFSCHGVIRHGPSAQFMQLDQMECQSCHKQQHMILRSTYKSAPEVAHVAGDGSAVSPMFMVHVDCTGCHVQEKPLSTKPQSGATVAKASAAGCDTCHKAGLGATMIPMWQKNTRELYESVAKMVPAGDGGSAKEQQSVTEAKRLLEIVRMDGSWGVHNPRYTQKLLEQAKTKLLEARESAKPKEGAAQ